MKTIMDEISQLVAEAFAGAGYDEKYGKVTLSNRPDLCEYQCNGAMAAAREYKKAPIMIAGDVAAALEGSEAFEEVDAAAPGFLNLKVKASFLTEYLNRMSFADRFGLEKPDVKKKTVIDYGGPNVAKPLHVGHLRSAVIGESIKRILRFLGNETIGEITR